MFSVDRRLWLTRDRSRVVDDGDPDAAFLFAAAPGSQVTEEDAQRYGLMAKPAEPQRGAERALVPDNAPEHVLDEHAFPTAGGADGADTGAATEVKGMEEHMDGLPADGEQLGPDGVEPAKYNREQTEDKAVRGPRERPRTRAKG